MLTAIRTPTGIGIVIAAFAGGWGLLGLPAARGVALLGVVVASMSLLLRYGNQQAVSNRVHDSRNRLVDLESAGAKAREGPVGLEALITKVELRLQAGLDEAAAAQDRIEAASMSAQAAIGQELILLSQQVTALERQAKEAVVANEHLEDLLRQCVRRLRAEVGDLEGRLPRGDRSTRPADVDSPLVSFAIPGFNRPMETRACIESIVAQVEEIGTNRVEIWITDDASSVDAAPRISREFAVRHPFVGFVGLEENIGLEANLVKACEPCRGDYVVIMGCDDLLFPGGLEQLLADLSDQEHAAVFYAKERIDSAGQPFVGLTEGAKPAGMSPGERRSYETIIDYAAETGVISGLGFISGIAFRRLPFVDVDSARYMGLTLYPQVGVMLEAFHDRPAMFHNFPLVFHRTPTMRDKLAEAIGTPVEGFMVGGHERDRSFLGSGLGAMLQRVCDVTALTPTDFLRIPERLFNRDSMVDFVAANVEAARDAGIEFDPAAEADAERFLAAFAEES